VRRCKNPKKVSNKASSEPLRLATSASSASQAGSRIKKCYLTLEQELELELELELRLGLEVTVLRVRLLVGSIGCGWRIGSV
jgi:hypothetical protein